MPSFALRRAGFPAGILLLVACEPPPALGFRCDLGRPAELRLELPAELREVSGLAVTGDGRLLAHGDERATIYVVSPTVGTLTDSFPLAGDPRDDFEGLAVTGDGVALMTSTGRLLLAPLTAGQPPEPRSVETGLGGVCEHEGLAYDAVSDVLFLPCKEALDPRARGGLVVHRWAMAGRTAADPPRIVVPASTVARLLGGPVFRATAVEWLPDPRHLLILSSRPPAVLEVDSAGAVQGGAILDPRVHPQPEAITMMNGMMLIGDEGAQGRPATLTGYRCDP